MKNNIMLMLVLFVVVSLYAHQESVLFQELRSTYGDEKLQEMVQRANKAVAQAFMATPDGLDSFVQKIEQLSEQFTQEQKDELARLADKHTECVSNTMQMNLETAAAHFCIIEEGSLKDREKWHQNALMRYVEMLGSVSGMVWTMALLEQIDPQTFIHIMQETLKRDQQK